MKWQAGSYDHKKTMVDLDLPPGRYKCLDRRGNEWLLTYHGQNNSVVANRSTDNMCVTFNPWEFFGFVEYELLAGGE